MIKKPFRASSWPFILFINNIAFGVSGRKNSNELLKIAATKGPLSNIFHKFSAPEIRKKVYSKVLIFWKTFLFT
jgi:hypothetical protein